MASLNNGTRSPRRTWLSEPSCQAEGQDDSSRAAVAKAAGSTLTRTARKRLRVLTGGVPVAVRLDQDVGGLEQVEMRNPAA